MFFNGLQKKKKKIKTAKLQNNLELWVVVLFIRSINTI